jgi:hypothetical protein
MECGPRPFNCHFEQIDQTFAAPSSGKPRPDECLQVYRNTEMGAVLFYNIMTDLLGGRLKNNYNVVKEIMKS